MTGHLTTPAALAGMAYANTAIGGTPGTPGHVLLNVPDKIASLLTRALSAG